MNGDLITASELKDWLKKEKVVYVCGKACLIRIVPLLLLADENEDFWTLARKGKDALAERISGIIANPKLPQFRKVILHGVRSPKISIDENEGGVPVDLVLSNYKFAVGLYVEIINFTLESIPKTEA